LEGRTLIIDRVSKAVLSCSGMGVGVDELYGSCRQRSLITLRHTAFFVLDHHFGLGCSEIGKMLGYNHATIIHGSNSAANSIERHADWGSLYLSVIDELALRKLPWINPHTSRITPFTKNKYGDLKEGDVVIKRGDKRVGFAPDEDQSQYIKPVNYTKEELAKAGLERKRGELTPASREPYRASRNMLREDW
jgi:hypothetical protein